MNIVKQIKQSLFCAYFIFNFISISTTAFGQCPPNIDTLAMYNIVLADIPSQVPIVKKWLETNPYSGYPALLKKICLVMGSHKLIGDAPSLMVINHENLVLHKRDDGNPITNEDQIDLNNLKKAIFEAWMKKNTGLLSSLPTNSTFNNILKQQITNK